MEQFHSEKWHFFSEVQRVWMGLETPLGCKRTSLMEKKIKKSNFPVFRKNMTQALM